MADRGFETGDNLQGAFNPSNFKEFSLRDKTHTRRITSAPVHVERKIQRTNLL